MFSNRELTPEAFWAVGQFYADFPQVGDTEAVQLLRASMPVQLVADDIGDLKVGDIVHYPGATARVLHMRYYPGLRDLLAYEDWRKIAPDATSRDEVLRVLQAGHAQTIRQTGAVAIELEVIREDL